MACTQGAGTTLHAWFQAAPAAPAYVPAAERPSQIVTERTVATTPKGQDVVVTMERLSTGGSRYEARYDHPTSGPMSDRQRQMKTRARTSLFPEKAREGIC
jgi:hypothetical protein